jgi:phospholipase A1
MKKLLLAVLAALTFSMGALSAEEDKIPFQKHNPNFITFGNQQDQTLLQFSFKYAVLKNRDLFIGYTQTSWWRLYDDSSPFYLTHYNPEVFYQLRTEVPGLNMITFGFFEHKSNGMSGAQSRSYDSSYIKFTTDIWKFQLVNKFYAMYNLDGGNYDLVKYTGWWNPSLAYRFHVIDYFVYESIAVGFAAGGVAPDFINRGAVSVDLTFGIPFMNDQITPMLTFQYFRGYGVNLYDYDKLSQNFRAGIVLYR